MHPELLDEHIDRVARELTMATSHSRLSDDVRRRLEEGSGRPVWRLVAATAGLALIAIIVTWLGASETSELPKNAAGMQALAGRSLDATASLASSVPHEPVTLPHDSHLHTAISREADALLVAPLEIIPLSVQATEIQALRVEEIRLNDLPGEHKELK